MLSFIFGSQGVFDENLPIGPKASKSTARDSNRTGAQAGQGWAVGDGSYQKGAGGSPLAGFKTAHTTLPATGAGPRIKREVEPWEAAEGPRSAIMMGEEEDVLQDEATLPKDWFDVDIKVSFLLPVNKMPNRSEREA